MWAAFTLYPPCPARRADPDDARLHFILYTLYAQILMMRPDWHCLLLAYVSLLVAAAGEAVVPLLYGKAMMLFYSILRSVLLYYCCTVLLNYSTILLYYAPLREGDLRHRHRGQHARLP